MENILNAMLYITAFKFLLLVCVAIAGIIIWIVGIVVEDIMLWIEERNGSSNDE